MAQTLSESWVEIQTKWRNYNDVDGYLGNYKKITISMIFLPFVDYIENSWTKKWSFSVQKDLGIRFLRLFSVFWVISEIPLQLRSYLWRNTQTGATNWKGDSHSKLWMFFNFKIIKKSRMRCVLWKSSRYYYDFLSLIYRKTKNFGHPIGGVLDYADCMPSRGVGPLN